jgi:4-hydroxy-3-methylbut-2-en-1-yl diphosphate synthase IspG/GcpE
LPPAEQDIDDVLRKSNRNAELSNDPVIREKIRQRILESLQRKAAMLKLVCPACGVTITKLEAMSKHTAHCCPDILPPKAVQQVGSIQLLWYTGVALLCYRHSPDS